MRSETTSVALAEIAADVPNAIAAGPFGSNLVSRDYVSSGVPVIRGQNLAGRWVGGEFVFVSAEKALQLRANTARTGDIVFTQRGTLGQVSVVPEGPYPSYVISQSQMKLTVAPQKADRRFIYYACTAPDFVAQVHNNAVAAGVPHINLGIFRGLRVPLPSRKVQMEAADALSAIDDRIDLLRQTNATLESIAQALFKSWFVDFDPVRAKAEGREPQGMDAATAALFPSTFEESELGLIPKGWRVDAIGNVTNCVGGGTPSTKEPAYWFPEQHHWATPKDLSGLGSPVLLDTDRRLSDVGLSKVSSGLLPVGTLLMSSRAPIGYLAIAQVPLAINQGFIAILPGGVLPPEFLYFWSQANMDGIKQKANGSTFMEISKAAFRPIALAVPSQAVAARFSVMAETIFQRIATGEQQSRQLAELRNTLLPRLISGKLRIPEVQAQVEDAMT